MGPRGRLRSTGGGGWRGLLAAFVTLALIGTATEVCANPHAKRLYDDLLSNYNRLIRPVSNLTDKLTVKLGLKLSQLMDVDLKNQIMTTNVWVEQKWMDYKLVWDPEDYGGVDMLFVPSQHIWLPDIVLFNNADGKYEVTLMTKARLKNTGEVVWKPPAIYKSSCKINVEWFPFDEQSCDMKFGSWTYDGNQLDLKHVDQVRGSNIVNLGIDLSEFYLSVEWDILEVPATRNEEYYIPLSKALILEERAEQVEKYGEESLAGLDEEELNYRGELLTDITFYMKLRRKTLFYTVNLIIPCVGISFLTVLVFYLPSDSGEKVTLCISILLSLTVFFLLLAEIIPPTSLAVPLLGKYLLFTMILVSASICVTVGVLNIHFRSPATHHMSPWVKKVFIQVMPKLLFMQRPHYMPRYTAVPPDKIPDLPKDEDDCCRDGARSSRSDRRRMNGDVRGKDKWDDDDDSYKDDCTSRCHHHPHLTRSGSPATGTGTRSHSRGTGTLSSSHSHRHSHSHSHSHGHSHSHAHSNHRPSSHMNHHSNHLPPPHPGHRRFVGPPNGALPPEPPEDDLDLDDLDGGSDRFSPDGKPLKGRRRKSSSASANAAKQPLSQVADALKGVEFIAQHIKKADRDIEVIEDWKFIAMVLDRLFLFLFMAACLLGTGGIIFRAPSLYDMREPIGLAHSSIGLGKKFPGVVVKEPEVEEEDYVYEDELEPMDGEGGAGAGGGVEVEQGKMMMEPVYNA